MGSALLSFAKQLPWVAPIAFVVAGVAQAAADVHTLKRDAQIFAANVRSAENIMMQVAKKGKLGAVQETCEMLKFEMEEGLAFCHKLKTKYFVECSAGGIDKFKDISDYSARSPPSPAARGDRGHHHGRVRAGSGAEGGSPSSAARRQSRWIPSSRHSARSS